LEKALPAALAVPDLSGRIAAFAAALKQAGAGEVTVDAGDSGCRLTAADDPFAKLVDAVLGRSEDVATTGAAVAVLASMMALQEAGGSVRRVRGPGLTVDVVETPSASTSTPGSGAARWLFDDDLLISSALGLI
jgi:hypothetical protein